MEESMDSFKINLLGIGAIRIDGAQRRLYVDAFAHGVPPFETGRADLILVTHDDGDHFLPDKTARAARETAANVVGPPSIAYPLLAGEGFPPEQLEIIYPIHLTKPITHEVRGIKLKVYQTTHFNNWEPVHISYLIELADRKIYVAGDSFIMHEEDPDLMNLDAVICNLVTPVMDPAAGADLIEKVLRTFRPRHVIANHLIACDWTVSPADLAKEVEERRLNGVVVIETPQQVFEVPKAASKGEGP
jgi:L-ascorbate metabolism protein UlaG (beta-lactamase superfamily)